MTQRDGFAEYLGTPDSLEATLDELRLLAYLAREIDPPPTPEALSEVRRSLKQA